MRTVAIVGVGLIGGSFARAIRAAGFSGSIVGVSSPPAVAEALRLGVIDAAESLEVAVAGADLVYLAQPIRRIIETLSRLDGLVRPGALVTDAGSTKREIAAAARRGLRRALFLGGHPMAGKETRGVSGADPNLFRGRTYLLSPLLPGDIADARVVQFRSLLEAIGARVHVLSAEEHDRLVALTSHLPQLLSTALSATLDETLDDRDLAAGGPGLFDMTRLALSSYDIWADILSTNPDAIEAALDACLARLQQLRASLRDERIAAAFQQGAAFSARLRNRES